LPGGRRRDGLTVRATFVGVGDAFSSGGRAHACIRLEASSGRSVALDFGAATLPAWKRLGLDARGLDAVIVSHLHGDHFGGLPFLLLDAQFSAARRRPLTILGPHGLTARLAMLMEAMFPGSTATAWRFDWSTREIAPDEEVQIAGFGVRSFAVDHPAGAMSTALRVTQGNSVFAYSGDTSWTPTLVAAARGADVFACECFSGGAPVLGHLDWPTLRARLDELQARKIVLVHMNDEALGLHAEMRAAGVTPAFDGLTMRL
jgi:ribonuclease BN (tRNA processing enzyme)